MICVPSPTGDVSRWLFIAPSLQWVNSLDHNMQFQDLEHDWNASASSASFERGRASQNTFLFNWRR